MIKNEQISPWSIYDKNLRVNPLILLNPQQKQKQERLKKDSSINQNRIFQRLFLSKKQINLIGRLKNQNSYYQSDLIDWGKIEKNQNRIEQKSLDGKKTIKRRQIDLKVAQIFEFQPSLELDNAYRLIKQQLRKNLMLKIIKRKLNEQVNLLDDMIYGQLSQSKSKQPQHIFSPTIFPQIKYTKDEFLEKINNSYQPLSIKIKKNAHQQQNLQTSKGIQKKNNVLKRSLSTLNQHLNATQRILLAQQLRFLEKMTQLSENQKKLQKQVQFMRNRFARPLFKNNGIYLKKPM